MTNNIKEGLEQFEPPAQIVIKLLWSALAQTVTGVLQATNDDTQKIVTKADSEIAKKLRERFKPTSE